MVRAADRAIIGEALTSREGIAGLRAWREVDESGQSARRFRRVFDRCAAVARAVAEHPSDRDALVRQEHATDRGAVRTRLDAFAAVVRARAAGLPEPDVPHEVRRVADDLANVATSAGAINVLELLSSPRVPYALKADWFQARCSGAIAFLSGRDAADARARAEAPPADDVVREKEENPTQNLPPQSRDRLRPTMDEMERAKEGAPDAWYTIAPARGGYATEDAYDVWDPATLEWAQTPKRWDDAPSVAPDVSTVRIEAGIVHGGGRTTLPIPMVLCPTRRHSSSTVADRRGSLRMDAGTTRLRSRAMRPLRFLSPLARGSGRHHHCPIMRR